MDIAIIADEFALGSPAQQLLDRFLFSPDTSVIACCPSNKFLMKREQTARFRINESIDKTVASTSNIVLVGQKAPATEVVPLLRPHHRVFVYGPLAPATSPAQVLSGSMYSTILHVPEVALPPRARIKDTLLVGNLEAVDALVSVLDREPLKLKSARTLTGQQVWDAQDREWSTRLLASAFSRADKIQGNTLLDGRTEDMVGLGLVPKFAKNPRAHVFQFANNCRAVVLELEGAVADLLLAIETESSLTRRGKIYSTQLHQGATPQREEFGRLASVIIDFFQSGRAPWSPRRSNLAAQLYSALSL